MTHEEGQAHIEEHLEELLADVGDVKVVLKGYNGKKGLCQQVENNTRQIQRIWIILAILVASSGGGAYAITNALLGG